MIDSWRILSALRDYYAPDGTDDELMPLCAAAARELEIRLKSGADCSDIRLINALV